MANSIVQNGATPSFNTLHDGNPPPLTDSNGYSIIEQPYGTKRPLRIILMGAGASALNFLHHLSTLPASHNLTVVCYDKNDGVGGTWHENKYPGCACDIPAVNYQFSWRIRTWSRYYAPAEEIGKYLKDIEADYGWIENGTIKLKHAVQGATWDEEQGVWKIQVKNLETGENFIDTAEVFVNAGGVLNSWKWPNIPGLSNFKGKLMHSAQYDTTYDLKGKKVAVVGAGSSGVQLVATIQKDVDKLYHWIKSPTWITAGFAQKFAGPDGQNFAYTPSQLKFLEQNPQKYLEYRKQIENELNQRFHIIIRGSKQSVEAREYSMSQMRQKLASKPDLAETIIPKDFNPGCRRPTPAPGYLEALCEDNVTVFTDSIDSFDATGFVDSKTKSHFDVDAVICATGFDTSWLPRFPVIGQNKTSLSEQWSTSDGVTPYLCVAVPNFPNHFTFCGPYGPVGHGSFMPLIESWTSYIFSVVEKMQIENIKSISPRMSAARDFRAHADLFLKRTAWSSPCRSWFKAGTVDGQLTMWPGSRLHHLELVKAPRYEDYEIEYWNQNRFAFLGNGFEIREHDGRDITYYLGSLEQGNDLQPEYDEGLVEMLKGCTIETK